MTGENNLKNNQLPRNPNRLTTLFTGYISTHKLGVEERLKTAQEPKGYTLRVDQVMPGTLDYPLYFQSSKRGRIILEIFGNVTVGEETTSRLSASRGGGIVELDLEKSGLVAAELFDKFQQFDKHPDAVAQQLSYGLQLLLGEEI